MTDREFLEHAAKAAGIVGAWKAKANPSIHASNGPDTIEGFFIANPRGGYGKLWNPLTDDGDAFRLAVALRLSVRLYESEAGAHECHEPYGADPAAATRRAIVRAAAEIGKDAAPSGA